MNPRTVISQKRALGVDIGRTNDRTVMILVEQRREQEMVRKVNAGCWRPGRKLDPEYHILGIKSLPPGLTNDETADAILAAYKRGEGPFSNSLVVDRTGLGAGVFDRLCALRGHPNGVQFTGGRGWRKSRNVSGGIEYTASKEALIQPLHHVMDTGRLGFNRQGLDESERLARELEAFTAKPNHLGHIQYAAAGTEHDDYVAALMLAIWWLADVKGGQGAGVGRLRGV